MARHFPRHRAASAAVAKSATSLSQKIGFNPERTREVCVYMWVRACVRVVVRASAAMS